MTPLRALSVTAERKDAGTETRPFASTLFVAVDRNGFMALTCSFIVTLFMKSAKGGLPTDPFWGSLDLDDAKSSFQVSRFPYSWDYLG